MTKGMSLDHVVQCLQGGGAIWIAVGGGRELHPHIRKVHTGAARIALQCGDVWLVPMHIAFEADGFGESGKVHTRIERHEVVKETAGEV